MSFRVFDCPICGWNIAAYGDVVWSAEFRGLYSSAQEGVVLTGVGRYSHPGAGAPTFVAPPNPAARWDDPGYGNPEEHQFGVMTQPEINNRHGFVVHDACWSLLTHVYAPREIPHARFFDILSSFPMTGPANCIDWGHDYGGLYRSKTSLKVCFPWEEDNRFVDRDLGYPQFKYDANPLAFDEVQEILSETPQALPPWNLVLAGTKSSFVEDPFHLLPEELCDAIAAHLPTRDALNARLASRSFWPMFHSQPFWASRFRRNHWERSWLFEAAQELEATGGVGRRDWRWSYHRTANARLGPGLWNRKRIWPLVQDVADILHLSWNEVPFNTATGFVERFTSLRPVLGETTSEPLWATARGNMKGSGTDFNPLTESCKCDKVQRLVFPVNSISEIAASTVHLSGAVYIAGLSLTATNGEVLHVGYTAAGSGSRIRLEKASLMGFNLAVGPSGIHALQTVSWRDEPTQVSAWLGRPNDGPKTQRLSAIVGPNDRAMALKLGFDGFRMVSFGAAPHFEPHIPVPHETINRNLRQLAIWDPDVPSPTLDLNESFLVSPELYMSGFRPLFWTWFGGPRGIHLSNLVKITIVGLAILRVDFTFDNPKVPAERHQFPRRELDSDEQGSKMIEFTIDGPQGELINKIEIVKQLLGSKGDGWGQKEGCITWLKIHTNRGRALELGSKSKPRKDIILVEKEIPAAPGTVITGFYGVQMVHLGFGLTSLGVITEPLLET